MNRADPVSRRISLLRLCSPVRQRDGLAQNSFPMRLLYHKVNPESADQRTTVCPLSGADQLKDADLSGLVSWTFVGENWVWEMSCRGIRESKRAA